MPPKESDYNFRYNRLTFFVVWAPIAIGATKGFSFPYTRHSLINKQVKSTYSILAGLCYIILTPQLKITIDRLYEVFSKYPGNPAMQGSRNYDDLETWNRELFLKPLRALTAKDLSRFTGKVMTTWGKVNDFKHFLPRIFELTAQLDTPFEIWIAFGKLEYGNWHSWDDSYQRTQLSFLPMTMAAKDTLIWVVLLIQR